MVETRLSNFKSVLSAVCLSYFTSLHFSSRAGSHTHTHTHTLSLSLSQGHTFNLREILAGPRHLPRVRTPPHPPGAVHRRAAGRRRAAHAARPAHRRRTAGASAALRAVRRLLPVPGRRGTAGRPRVSAHGRRARRKAGAERGPRRDGATRLIESRIVLELHAASVPHTDL